MIHRYSSVIRVFNLIIRQGLFFTLLMFAYAGIFLNTISTQRKP